MVSSRTSPLAVSMLVVVLLTAGHHTGIIDEVEQVVSELGLTLAIKSSSLTGTHWDLTDDSHMTVLTALTDIGTIKGTIDVTDKDPRLYSRWLEIFRVIHNPVVFFTDREDTGQRMRETRAGLPTLIIIYEKYSSWAFSHVAPRYEEIFSLEFYPKHHPNTLYSEYATVTHTKFEFMQIASRLNYFQTDILAWLDAGFYRDFVENGDFTPFTLMVPNHFISDRLALNSIRLPDDNEPDDHRYIMKYSQSFISGGFWFGNATLLQIFTAEYRDYVETLLDEGLANCDEQVLASMFLESTLFKPLIEAQMFPADDGCDPWSCLGFTLRDKGMNFGY